MDDPEKLKDTKLPPIKAFHSKLKLSGISKSEYKHAQKVYKEFGCEASQDYHDLYLKSDVLLLSDIVVNFKKHKYRTLQVRPS